MEWRITKSIIINILQKTNFFLINCNSREEKNSNLIKKAYYKFNDNEEIYNNSIMWHLFASV